MKKFEKSAGVFLDLASCGSSIRYGVSMGIRKWRVNVPVKDGEKRPRKREWKHSLDFDFDLSMTDCSRSVTWTASSAALAEKKLRIAIRVFEQVLRHVHTAKIYGKREMRRLKKEKADG